MEEEALKVKGILAPPFQNVKKTKSVLCFLHLLTQWDCQIAAFFLTIIHPNFVCQANHCPSTSILSKNLAYIWSNETEIIHKTL